VPAYRTRGGSHALFLSINPDSLDRGQTSEVRAAFSADLASTGCGPTEESHFLLGHLYDLQAFPERSAGSRYSVDGSSKGGNSTAQVPRGGEAAALVRPESHVLDFGPCTPNTLGSSFHTSIQSRNLMALISSNGSCVAPR